MRLAFSTQFILEGLGAEVSIRKAMTKLIKFASRLSEQELRAHKGIHLHRIQNQFDPEMGLPLESMEVTDGVRLKCLVQGGKLVLLSLHTDHDEIYGKR